MLNIKDLLNDQIINKSELINKRHKYLGLDAAQAAFIAKIFVNNNDKNTIITQSEAAKLMGVEEPSAKKIIEFLVLEGLVKVTENNSEVKFDFEFLIEKLISTYLPPSSSSSIEQKVDWAVKVIGIEFSNENRIELTDQISNTNWDLVLVAINEFKNQTNKTFPLLVSLIKAINNDKKENDGKIKSLMQVNWLEE